MMGEGIAIGAGGVGAVARGVVAGIRPVMSGTATPGTVALGRVALGVKLLARSGADPKTVVGAGGAEVGMGGIGAGAGKTVAETGGVGAGMGGVGVGIGATGWATASVHGVWIVGSRGFVGTVGLLANQSGMALVTGVYAGYGSGTGGVAGTVGNSAVTTGVSKVGQSALASPGVSLLGTLGGGGNTGGRFNASTANSGWSLRRGA